MGSRGDDGRHVRWLGPNAAWSGGCWIRGHGTPCLQMPAGLHMLPWIFRISPPGTERGPARPAPPTCMVVVTVNGCARGAALPADPTNSWSCVRSRLSLVSPMRCLLEARRRGRLSAYSVGSCGSRGACAGVGRAAGRAPASTKMSDEERGRLASSGILLRARGRHGALACAEPAAGTRHWPASIPRPTPGVPGREMALPRASTHPIGHDGSAPLRSIARPGTPVLPGALDAAGAAAGRLPRPEARLRAGVQFQGRDVHAHRQLPFGCHLCSQRNFGGVGGLGGVGSHERGPRSGSLQQQEHGHAFPARDSQGESPSPAGLCTLSCRPRTLEILRPQAVRSRGGAVWIQRAAWSRGVGRGGRA